LLRRPGVGLRPAPPRRPDLGLVGGARRGGAGGSALVGARAFSLVGPQDDDGRLSIRRPGPA
jgi:hypothetical protein